MTTPTTTKNCVPTTTIATSNCCIHPFKFLFDTVAEALQNPNTRSNFAETLDRLLDKGVIITNCNICCSECASGYSLASVETQLKFLEALGFTSNNQTNDETCCSNVYASVETYLKYLEPIDIDQLAPCCNGFNKCVDDLLCWITGNSNNGADDLDRILDKGIVEFGGIFSNCSPASNSELCYLLQLIQDYNALEGYGGSRVEFIDRILDKGITIGCGQDGQIVIMSSVETYLKYAEAVNAGPVPPALPVPTTSTTTVI